MIYIFVALLLLAFSDLSSGTVRTPLIDLPNYGKLEGTIKFSENGTLFYSFEGVPYANPPVGVNRFEEPLALERWNNVRKADTIHMCLQYRHLNINPEPEDPVIGSEDCLYLNIYTPTLDPNANLDVILYIHGGAFMFNWGGFQRPDFLLNNKVIYINLNYRLGPLGFLSTEDDVVPGNNGLKDQIAAMKWIQNNIRHFGGNPSSLTITGNSAGGASVHMHYLIPESRGLFARGVSQSGTALNPWVIMDKPLEKTKTLASYVNCPTGDNTGMIECLKKVPGRQIVEAIKIFQPWLFNPFSPFGVAVDTWASQPLLKQHPYQLLKNRMVYDVPWLPSHVSSEGLYPVAEFYSKEEYIHYINKNWNSVIHHIMQYNDTVDSQNILEVARKIRHKYFHGQPLNKETFNNLVQAVSDRLYVVDIRKAIQLHARAVSSPVYFYYFKYRGKHSRSDSRSNSTVNFGTAHADDASYIFKMNLDSRSDAKDKKISDFIIRMWLSYAHTGTPDVSPYSWTPVSKTSKALNSLTIVSTDEIEMEEIENFGNADFWNSLPLQENEHLFQ